jgi:acetyl esterase
MRLAGQILFYPATDMLAQTPSKEAFASDYLLTSDDMVWFGELYLHTMSDALSPMASPARSGNLKGLAPAFIATAEYDPLRDEGEAYAAALLEAGVPVTQHRYAGMIHGFVSVPFFDQASQALRAAARFIHERGQ